MSIKNINIKNFSQDYTCDLIKIDSSLIMTGISDHRWTYISLGDDKDSYAVIRCLDPNWIRFMVQDQLLLDYFKELNNLEWLMTCEKLVYKGPEITGQYDVIDLVEDDASYIQENNDYGDLTDEAYIRERIKLGTAIGLKKNNTLVAWVLTHDDGAIGFIKVLEAYRGQGLAQYLTEAMIQRLQTEDKIPFVHIESSNKKSLNLAKKAGFEYFGHIHWLKLKGDYDV